MTVYNVRMRFTVPQFIEIEDKIFGPLTWKQFLYVGGGFGMSIVLFMVAPFPIFLLFGVPIAILASALAFFPVNNRPFSAILEAAVNYYMGEREYYWRNNKEHVYRAKKTKAETEAAPPADPSAPVRTANISSLARRLELEAIQRNDT